MTFSWLNLRKIIGNISFSIGPDYLKDSLSYAVSYPVVAHIDSFGAPKLDGIIGNAYGSCIVCIYLRWRLLITHSFKYSAFEIGMLGIDKKRSILSLGSGAADCGDGTTHCKDRSIHDVVRVAFVAEVVDASSDGTSFFL